MINLSSVTLAFGGQIIFNDVTWAIGHKDRVGLVGGNGSGKTTLMRLICGQIRPDEGDVIVPKGVTVGYLPQDQVVHEGKTLFDEAASALGDVYNLRVEEERLRTLLDETSEGDEHNAMAARYAEVHANLDQIGGYMVEQTVGKVLSGLGFSQSDMGRLCQEFSGGWQMRIALAKVLLANPSLLLLDEPTNYLDIEARVFLEEWLKGYEGALILVSHDRYFIDRVLNRITEIFHGKLSDYYCNYTQFLVERAARLELLQKKAAEIEQEREHIQNFINRFRYKADKATLVQSRVRQLEKLEKVEIPPVKKKIRFDFPQPSRSGKVALEAKELKAGYGNGPDIIKGINFELYRGSKVALVGVNGAGKTTLVRLITKELEPRSGSIALGYNVSYDYFAQDIHKRLDPALTVFKTVEASCPFDLIPKLRSLLGAFLFTGEEIDKKVSVLSGGERNRLAIAKMLLTPSNLIVMDEPTNHLDLDSKEVLLEALQKFEGSVLFVSHDRHFLDNLADTVFALEDGALEIYKGNYTEWLEYRERRKTEAEGAQSAAKQAAKNSAKQTAESEQSGVSDKELRVRQYEEAKRRSRLKDSMAKKVTKIEEEIAAKEDEVKTLAAQMTQPQYATNFVELQKLIDKRERMEKEIEKLTNQWADACRELESLGE